MVRILCCMVSVFAVATEAQICANNDQFDASVSCDFVQEGSTCGEMLSHVTDLDFVPSATTCQEAITFLVEEQDWDSDLEKDFMVWRNRTGSRLRVLADLTSCCKDGKTSCDGNDYMWPICKNMNKFNGSVEVPGSYFSYGLCAEDTINYLGDAMTTFSPSATACQRKVEYASNLQMVLASMSMCCEDGETACSDFHAPICENKDQFDGFVNSGVAMRQGPEATCSLVSSTMDAFVPSKETCSEQITMPGFVCCDGTEPEEEGEVDGMMRGGCGGQYEVMCGRGNMSRMLVLEQLASCCTDGNTACDPYKATTTTTTGASSNAVKQVCFSAVVITAGLML